VSRVTSQADGGAGVVASAAGEGGLLGGAVLTAVWLWGAVPAGVRLWGVVLTTITLSFSVKSAFRSAAVVRPALFGRLKATARLVGPARPVATLLVRTGDRASKAVVCLSSWAVDPAVRAVGCSAGRLGVSGAEFALGRCVVSASVAGESLLPS
jgi:hypothetical protein